MNLFKKVIATIAMTTLVITTTVSSVGAFVSDSATAAANLAAKGVIVSHDDVADYKLGSLINRQEVAAMAFSIAKLEKKATCDNEYSDVSATTPNTWACYVVEALRDNGYLAKNAKFKPESNITKAEALGMMVSAAFGDAYKYDATKGTTWQEQLVDFAVSNDVLAAAFTDYNTAATRGVVFQWTVDSMDSADSDDLGDLGDLIGDLDGEEDTTDDTTDDTTTDDIIVSTSSDLVVDSNPEAPAGADLPKGADGVLVLKLDVTAGNEDTSVTEFNFERIGFGEDAADKVSLFANGTRLTKSKSFNSDDEANVSVSPALVVKAGETVTVDVRVDTSDTEGEFALKLTGVTASTNVEANEIVSNTFDVKGVDATVLEFNAGSVNSQVTAGETDAEIMEFDLENKGNVSNSDVTVTAITLKEIGTVDQEADLANLSLVMNGGVVATVDAMAGKYVTFNLDTPVVIKDGKTETFTVTADVVGGADKNVKFILDTNGDIVATASKYAAVNVENNFAGQEVSVQAGELTIYAVDAENDKIRDDKDDVVLGTLKIVNVAGENLNIKNLGVQLVTSASGVAEVLENIKAEINGTSYDLYADSAAVDTDTDVVYSDTDLDITLPQGTTMVTIMADTLDDLNDGETITMSLTVNDAQLYVEESDDDTQVTDVTPSVLSFDELEIKQPKATVAKTPLADVAVVKGTADITALQFEVEANETSALTIDKVNVKVKVLSGATDLTSTSKDYVSEVKLYKGSVSESNKLDSLSGNKLGSDGSANFDGFETTIAADATETFIVVVSTVDSDQVVDKKVSVSFSSIDVEDDENDTVTVVNTAGSFEGKVITLKDSGTLTINIAGSADNSDNEQAKTILAGTEQAIFSVDTKATNEEIDLEKIAFVIASNSGAELRDSIVSAKLYLGNNLVATTTNSKITYNAGDADGVDAGDVNFDDATEHYQGVTVMFEDMTNTIVPTTSDELRLVITTETIGYEKIGSAIAAARVAGLLVDANYAKGVESNEKISADIIAPAAAGGVVISKEFAIVPMIVTPSVSDTFGTDDLNATIAIATDAGDNTTSNDGASLTATLSGLTIEVTSLTQTGTITVFNGNGDNVGTANVDAAGDVTISINAGEYISNGESYRLETTAEASFRLAKDGVEYTVDTATYKTNLNNTEDMGSYSKS